MNETPNLTTAILIEIRDAVRSNSDRIDATNERLDATRSELSQKIDSLVRRQTEAEIRLATELVAVNSSVKELTQVTRKNEAIRGEVGDLKRRVEALERRGA